MSESILSRLEAVFARKVLVIVFFLLISVTVLSPFLFGGRIFMDTDATVYYYPIFHFYHESLARGESILWNPLIFSGFPTYLSQSAGFFDPLNLALFSFIPPLSAYHIRLTIDFVLVMLFSYLAARAWGASRLAAMLVGMMYILAFNWRFISNAVIANSLFLVPLLFYVSGKIREGRYMWRWAALAGLGAGWSFLAGYAQFTVYALLLFGLGNLLIAFFSAKDGTLKQAVLQYGGVMLLVGATAFLVGLPQILPALTFSSETVRSGGLAYEVTTLKSVELGDTLLFLFPDYSYFPYLTSGRKPLYIGALWFLLALAALATLRSNISARITAILFGFAFLASLKWSPIFYMLQKLPVFEYFRFPYRWMYLGAWFLALLGAFGFDALGSMSKQSLKKAYAVIGVPIVVFGFLVLALNAFGDSFWRFATEVIDQLFAAVLYGNFGFDKDPVHYLDALQRGVSAWRDLTSFTAVSFAFPFLVLYASFFLIAAFIWERIAWPAFRVGAFLISLVTFIGVFAVQWPATVPAAILTSHEDTIGRFIPSEDRSLYRTYPFMLDRGFQNIVPPTYVLGRDQVQALTELQFAAGWPNLHMFSKIASADGYDPFLSRGLLEGLTLIGSTHGAQDNTKSLPDQEKIDRLLRGLGVIGAMSGKYIISGVELADPKLSLLGKEAVSRYNIPLYVYKNATALPRALFANRTAAAPGAALYDLIQRGADFETYAYLDCEACATPSSSGRIESAAFTNGRIELHLKAVTPGWVVVSESFLPGWVGTLNNERVEIIRANGYAIAVAVPPGNHQLVLEYRGVR